MTYRANEIVEMIEKDWTIGEEVICEYSDDEFDFDDSDGEDQDMQW